jgi:hypothetical protein
MASRKPITPTSGVILAVSGTTGPASGIRYTLNVNAIGGGVVTIPFVRPTRVTEWIRSGGEVVPFAVGSPVDRAYWVGDYFRWDDVEEPAWGECEETDTPAPVREDDPNTVEDESQLPATDTSVGSVSGAVPGGGFISGDKGENTL